MNNEDLTVYRQVRSAVARRELDTTRLDIAYMHGSVVLRGFIARLPGRGNIDLKQEVEHLNLVLHKVQGVRDVVFDVKVLD